MIITTNTDSILRVCATAYIYPSIDNTFPGEHRNRIAERGYQEDSRVYISPVE